MKEQKDISTYISKDLLLFLYIFFGVITLSLFIRIFQTNCQFAFSFAFLPVGFGMIYEQKTTGASWKEILIKSFASYCIVSLFLLVFLKDQRTAFSQMETGFLLSVFILSFSAISIAFAYYLEEQHKLTAQITEGFLLLQSLSFVYFIASSDFFSKLNYFKIALIIPVLFSCLYVIYHIFFCKKHSYFSKLYQSIWSSVMMLFFSISFFMKVLTIEISKDLSIQENLLGSLQYFLFGISIIYITQNVWMLIRFFPDKGEKLNHYKFRIKTLTKEHIERFSDTRLSLPYAVFCIVFVSTIYLMNYFYHYISAHTMI